MNVKLPTLNFGHDGLVLVLVELTVVELALKLDRVVISLLVTQIVHRGLVSFSSVREIIMRSLIAACNRNVACQNTRVIKVPRYAAFPIIEKFARLTILLCKVLLPFLRLEKLLMGLDYLR